MYSFDAEKVQRRSSVHLFNLCIILLLGIGLVTLYSASYAFAQRFFYNGNYFIVRQLIFAAAGIVLYFLFSHISYAAIRKCAMPVLGLSFILCILTIIPNIGVERYGASRWIEIGSLSYQPSELVKFALPLYLAHFLDKKADNINNLYPGILVPVVVTGIFFLIIYKQNNFSTAVFIIFNVLVIFYLAGMRFRYFLTAITIVIPVSALLVFTKEHRVRRLISFIRPQWDPLGAGFQVNASRDAIISGGFWGKGIGEGTRKIASIPEIHSDFIFSSYAEETGFLGIIFLFGLFTALAVIGYRAAWHSETVFGSLIAAGFTTMIVSQALLNIAVVSGALPATGIPLPFFSAGGSSLLTTLVSAGLIANVVRNNSLKKDVTGNSIKKNRIFNRTEESNDF